MAKSRLHWPGRLAIGLAVLGSLIATVNEVESFRRTGALDWGHVALIVGVPAFMYAVIAKHNSKPPSDPGGDAR